MNSYDIKCKIIEEELKSVWPEWHVVCRLGGGSFGDVFQIYRDNFGIRVDAALKVIQVDRGPIDDAFTEILAFNRQNGLNPEDGRQSAVLDSLRNEIKIMEVLHGAPNIVAIEDYYFKQDDSAGSLFVRMELLTSLQDILQGRHEEHSLFSIPEICKLGRDICTALIYCEKKDIIHRDIKPANLFLDRFGDYKVGDFGASRHMDTLYTTQNMTGIGTISYMAPEIFRGSSYDNTVDIYSLGLVLYQLLNNGRMPFLQAEGSYTARDIDSANYQRLHGIPVPVLIGKTVGGEQIDPWLDAAVRKACAMNPEDRYQTAKEFYDALSRSETEEYTGIADSNSGIAELNKGIAKLNTGISESAKKSSDSSSPDRPSQSQHKKKDHSSIRRLAVGIAVILIFAAALLVFRQGSGEALDSSSSAVSGVAGTNSDTADSDIAGEALASSSDGAVGVSDTGSVIEEKDITSIPDDTMAETASDTGLLEAATEVDESVSGQITDSWEEIIASGEDGTYIEKYKIGDTKNLDLGEEGLIEMELVALDADELADESGKAHMTWIAKNLLNTEHSMNPRGSLGEVHNKGGWPESDMRAWLQESILPLFPETVRSNIKEVKKYSYSYTDEGTVSSADKIWIPSTREIFGAGNTREDQGPEYLTAYPDDASRLKYHIDSFEAFWWWLRSTDYYGDYYFASVDFTQSTDSGGYSRLGGVVVGFCL